MKKNVLVFPCGSEIGLEIHKSLNLSTHFEIFGGSSVHDHGAFVYKNYIDGLPFVDDPQFINSINGVIKEHKIDFIIPAHDDVILRLAYEKSKNNLACELVTSPLETCKITRSKSETYKFFRDITMTPKQYDTKSIGKNDLPIFLKPDAGQGSKGTHLAKTMEQLAFYSKQNQNLIAIEYLPGREYTVDCFTNQKGELIFCEGRERVRTLNGISVNTKTVRNPEFQKIAQKINTHISLRGVWFFQVKENKDGDLLLLEIAPRVAGTMALVRAKGVNLVLLSLFDLMDFDVSILENDYDIVLDRALSESYQLELKYSHVYLDFDDTVIFEGRVNPAAIRFIFQCINNKVKIHLITRHKEVLSESLEKYRLAHIFDSQILVKEGEEKAQFIKEKDAIFIDDSFSERRKVHDACGIPAFDSHMLDSLMEKF